MIIKESLFLKSAVNKKDYPDGKLSEIAFAGRSNVGKSSFINKILNRRNLARVSKTQGKTTLINFFLVNNKFILVDLPGYGYANVAKEKKATWGAMIEGYLNTRKELKAVFLLLDIRHAPTKDDLLMLEYIRGRNFKPVVILTKADKLAKTKVSGEVEKFHKFLNISDIYPFSAQTGFGKEEILKVIGELI